jgi:hypothetical protein
VRGDGVGGDAFAGGAAHPGLRDCAQGRAATPSGLRGGARGCIRAVLMVRDEGLSPQGDRGAPFPSSRRQRAEANSPGLDHDQISKEPFCIGGNDAGHLVGLRRV